MVTVGGEEEEERHSSLVTIFREQVTQDLVHVSFWGFILYLTVNQNLDEMNDEDVCLLLLANVPVTMVTQ